MRDSRTKYIKYLIDLNWPNMKSFAESNNIPYTTLRSIMQRGIGNASVNNVIKICEGLGITTDELIKWGKLFEIGSTIKEERKKQGISIEDLSKKTNISNKTLLEIEDNIIPVNSEMIHKITSAFKMSVQDFLIEYELYDEAIQQHFHIKQTEDKRKQQIQTIAAHIDEDVTEEEMQDIKEYIEFIKSKRK